MRNSILALLILLIAGCSQHKIEKEKAIIGFLDFIEEASELNYTRVVATFKII